MIPPTQPEFERLVLDMLASHYQMLTGERAHHFEKNLAMVFDAYRQQAEACAAPRK